MKKKVKNNMDQSNMEISEVIKNCLYNELTDEDNVLRFRFLNFIFTGDAINTQLTDYTYKRIGEIYGRKSLSFWKPLEQTDEFEKLGREIINLILEAWKCSREKTFAYYNLLKDLDGNIEHFIASESPPFKVKEDKFLGSHLLGDTVQDKSGAYYSVISKCMGDDESPLRERLCKRGILFLDIMPIPLPINSELRRDWSISFKVGKMCLSSFLLQLALDYAKEEYRLKITPKTKIALMMPRNTSAGIFHEALTNNEYLGCFNEQLRFVNRNEDEIELLGNGIIPPHFKSDVMGGANTPSLELLGRIIKIKNESPY